MGKHPVRRAIAGVGTVALAGALGSPAHAQVVPSVEAVSICTPSAMYDVEGHATGFPPDTDIVRVAQLNGGTYYNAFRTDADGNGIDNQPNDAPNVPFGGWIHYHSDDNGSGWADDGDTLILAGTFYIAMPCEGAPVVPK
jgi:hypothetical protein